MDRLIALVALRWRIDLRVILGARERFWGLVLSLPIGLAFSLLGAGLAYAVVRALAARQPESLPALLAVGATLLGLLWALAPLHSGVALTEAHDLTRLIHFPVPPRLLVLSSFVSNLTRPMVLGELPIAAALALALSGPTARLPFALLGMLATLAFIVACAQATGLALHGLSRNRRLHDLALFVGLGLAFLLSIGPFLLFAGGGRWLSGVLRPLVAGGLPLALPFGWGTLAAVRAGQGDLAGWALFLLASSGATLAVLAVSARLAERVYRGDVDVGSVPAARARPARGLLPGAIGALIEKDLRILWREPALKAMLVIGLAGPLVFLFFLTSLPGGRPPAASLLLLASFVGLGGLGSNAFGFERRALGLLLGFPVARWRLLLAKNAALALYRLPGLLTVGLAAAFLAPAWMWPSAAVIVSATLAIASGVDNFLSILFPVALPAPGRNPYANSGPAGRGLTGMLLNFAALVVVLALSAPFVFLAWLPSLLRLPALGLLTLPLGLLGALAVYAMLVARAAEVLERREPELLERILGEA
jgi:ABC-2 type transport system permease protein